MKKLHEILISSLLPIIKTVGIIEIKEVLAKFAEEEKPVSLSQFLKAMNSNFELLAEVAKKTKTKIDDGLIETILEAVRQFANENDIQL